MKIDRTRASRKAARRYNVSPVARAVRSVLTLSAAALMFSGTGVVLAKSPVVAPLPVERASLSHEFAKVVDLTRVSDEWTPKSVVDEEFQSFTAPMGVAQMFAAPSGFVEGLGPVDDPTVLPGSFHSGPGGVSGSDDRILASVPNAADGSNFNVTGTGTATSTAGFAIGVFIGSTGSFTVTNGANITANGETWAAGLELEAAGDITAANNTTLNATVNGNEGIAFGLYALADGGVTMTNGGAISATGAGDDSTAFGLYAVGLGANTSTTNAGTINANGTGPGADATGMYAASLYGDASGTNSNTINVSSNGGNAVGANAFSIEGAATETNTGTLVVSGYNATGLYAYSIYGDALVDNDGTLKVDGTDTAQGGWAKSYYGNATVDNGATGVVNVNGTFGAAGLIAGAYDGTATVTNAGSVSANSDMGVARGVFAYGDSAVVTNALTGTINAGGDLQAIAIDAEGFRGTSVTNDGALTATSNGDAIGVWATSYGDTSVINNGSVDVDAVNGIAYGIYAGGYDAYVRNFANVDATSVYGDAIGIGVGGVYAFAQNDDTINADGGSAGIGMFGYGVASTNLNNYGTINATASATEGFAAGILAVGDVAGAINGGAINAAGAFATGIDIRATSDGSAVNGNLVIVRGGDVTGISVRASGEGGTANVLNYGVVDSQGDLFAVGIAAVARAYLGTASVYNGSNVTASAKYGAAQGIVASADRDASVDNQGVLHTYGGDSAYGILALSADGDVNVDNGNEMITVAHNRGYGIAYGIAAQSNNGLVSITNDGMMITGGDATAMGIYASTKWNDVEVTNNGLLASVAKYGAATGAIAITYTGDANVSNGEDGVAIVQGGYSAGGLRAISLYGDANVINDGDVQTSGGVLDRGLTARSLYGGTATITNNGTITTDGGLSSYGVWARSDYGDAVVNNTGGIESYSQYGVAYGALAGGAYTISIDNSGDIRAYAGDTAAGVLAYSLGGDATVVNSNYLLGVSGNVAYGAQVVANVGTATLTNTSDGTIEASGYNVADAVFASGAIVNVTNNGTLTADADGWAAGIEAVGGDINLISNTGADISAYAYAGRATGMFANADGDATVRNGGTIDVDSYSGDAFGTFAQAGGNAVLTNGGVLTATSVQGDAFGMVGIGYNADLSQSRSITVSGYNTAVGIEGIGYAHANIVNNGDVSATAVSGLAEGLYTYSVHDTRQVNNGTIDVQLASGRAFGMNAYAFDDTELVNRAGKSIDVSVGNGIAYGMYGYGARTILDNDGSIDVTSGNGMAIGMLGVGIETSDVTNGETGTIAVHANQAFGLVSQGDVSTATNAGDIHAYGRNLAIAMQGIGDGEGGTTSIENLGLLDASAGGKYGVAAGIVGNAGGDVDIVNGGTINAHDGQDTYGIQGYSEYGSVSIANTGHITSYASFVTGSAYGIDASAYGDVTVTNTAEVLTGGKYATGISAISQAGDVIVDTDGLVQAGTGAHRSIGVIAQSGDGTASVTNRLIVVGASNTGAAFGIIAGSQNGSASIDNVEGATVYGIAREGVATGVYAFGPSVSITNGGDINANGGISAVGAGFDSLDATVVNTGAINVNQYGSGNAPLTVSPGNGIGIAGYVGEGGSAIVTNDGSIDVNAVDSAFGIQVGGYGDVTVGGTGSIHASATNGNAVGIDVRAFDDYAPTHVSVTTGGALDVASDHDSATGIHAFGTDVQVHNGGVTHVTGDTFAMGIDARGDTVSAGNTGQIIVGVTGADAPAFGISANGAQTATVDNHGDITVSAGMLATGIAAYFDEGGSALVTNDGGIDVSADGRASGIQVFGYGDVVIDGVGSIAANAVNGEATGIDVRTFDDHAPTHVSITTGGALQVASDLGVATGISGFGTNVDIHNGGATDVVGYDFALGVRAVGDNVSVGNTGQVSVDVTGTDGGVVGIGSYGMLASVIDNHGDVSVSAHDGQTLGLFAYSQTGNADIVSDASVTATSGGRATGLLAMGDGITIDHTGAITATGANATGIAAYIGGGGLATVTHDGSIDVDGVDNAKGLTLRGYGDMVIDGDGSIVASGDAATGVYARTTWTDDTVTNVSVDLGGTIDVEGVQAQGVIASGSNVDLQHTGTTNVAGTTMATGLYAGAQDVTSVVNGGDVTVASGSVAMGIIAVSGQHTTLHNTGHVTVSSPADGGSAFGLLAGGDDVSVVNGGTVNAQGDADTIGIDASGQVANVDNTGAITATAGHFARGIDLRASDAATLQNSADVNAMADLFAIGARIGSGGLATANNSGDIHAIAYHGDAIGAYAMSDYGNVAFTNSGAISAQAAGQTIGLLVDSGADATVTNSGLIGAVHTDDAVALDLDVLGIATVNNIGDIVAQASEEGSIAIHGGDGFDLVTNSGDIVGALVTGAGDDRLTNAAGGTWTVRGHATDFGDGDDTIVNAGTIVLHDAAISLGGNSTSGNGFTNNGMLSIAGDSAIDMGTGGVMTFAGNNAPISVLNPVAFTNNGTISFLDGAPDDTLTITGDFAGQGALDVDVSLLNGTSDMLYVDGNIVGNSVQSLNVNVLDLLTSATEIDIPVVVVEGESTEHNVQAGNIIAGNVNFNANNFLDLKVAVKTHLNADNSAVDMFSLTLGFGGLNDTGAIATAIAPGAHSLMAAQVGTFRQRLGVFSQLGDSDKGAWVRVFGDKGTITPDAQLDNLPATNNFAFDQTNQGVEAGVNALVTDGFFIGASLSKSRGKQDLANGFGSDDIDGTTVGGYVTWLGQNGMYADVSYRWMHFDADMTSLGGQREVGGDAGAFNAELGWNVWTSAGGMKLVPQVQYTRTKVENIDRIEGDLADFVSDGGTSSRARLGLEMEQTFQSASGTKWTPYGVVSIVREFDGETGFTVADTFTGRTSTEGTSGQLEFGVNAKIGQRVDVWGGLNYLDGGAIDGVWGGQLGIRYTW